jgi:beta-glucosidase
VDISERSLFEWYLPPYKAAVDAGAASVMTSFNEIAGVPATSDPWLLTELLREKWGFTGFIVTDYTAIDELIPHGVAANQSEAATMAIHAGVDMDMQDGAYQAHLAELVKLGRVSEALLNQAVRRILIAKYKLGLFDDPYLYCDPIREKDGLVTTEYRSFARSFAARSCVLLKNEKQTLPMPGDIRSVALIGPLGDSKDDMLGSWSAAGQANECVTLLEGLRMNVPEGTTVTYLKGCEVNSADDKNIDDALKLAMQSDFVILALGESRHMSGEAASRTRIGLPGAQEKLAIAVLNSGKPTAVVLFNGRPLAIPLIDSLAPAILETWFGGSEAGNGIADVLTGKYNPSGKLTMTFPRSEGQIPVFYNAKNTGRPVDSESPGEKYKSRYIDESNTPLYPFGYGLSYTTFTYSSVTLNKTTFRQGEVILASVDVTNSGNYDGEEVVQLYVHDKIGEVTRPLRELKGFRKIMLARGQSTKVSFTLTPDDLSYYHKDMHFGWDQGEFELYIGTSSVSTQQITFFIE